MPPFDNKKARQALLYAVDRERWANTIQKGLEFPSTLPWPKTSPFYYKPSKVAYAMLFREGGYFIHDAPWRSAFGPGTNAQTGTPGSNYTGTHGCINVPANVAQELFSWVRLGTVVQVVP